MHFDVRTATLTLAASLVLSLAAWGDEKNKVYSGAACAAPLDDYFVTEVWAKVGARSCLKCHKPGGEAEDSKFILQDPERRVAEAKDEALRHNRSAFAQMARAKERDESRLLLKAVGKLKHGGDEVLKSDSAGYKVLAEFVVRLPACWPPLTT